MTTCSREKGNPHRAQNYNPARMAPGTSANTFCQDIQKLLDFIAFLYDQPVPDQATNGPEFNISATGPDQFQGCSTSAEPFAASGRAPSLSPAGKSKTAPKMKPRKGLNVTLRGGRLRTSLEEYTAWCRDNKSLWSGNNPHSNLTAWFQVEKVRRTFCCCAFIEPGEFISSPL